MSADDEICERCGYRLGAHSAVDDLCPGSTRFVGTGEYAAADEYARTKAMLRKLIEAEGAS